MCFSRSEGIILYSMVYIVFVVFEDDCAFGQILPLPV